MNTKLISALILAVLFTTTACHTTNKRVVGAGDLPPLPQQFDGITTNDVHPGIQPVAVYRYKEGKVAFSAVGSMIRVDTNEWNVIVSEHIFHKVVGDENDYSYAFRIARPDHRRLSGFLGKVILNSKDLGGRDIAVVEASGAPTVISGFSAASKTNPIIFVYSKSVEAKRVEVKTLKSLITGKEVNIFGYGFRPTEQLTKMVSDPSNVGKTLTVDEDFPLIAIEEEMMEGKSGSLFIDDHNRVFLISSAMRNTLSVDAVQMALIKKKIGRAPKGITMVTGPLTLSPE